MTPAEFAKTVRPFPKSARTIFRLCRQGRIKGARLVNGKWMVPPSAQILGVGKRIEYGENKGISVKEYAAKHDVRRQWVYQLLNYPSGCRTEGAVKTPTGWDIPPDSPWPAGEW